MESEFKFKNGDVVKITVSGESGTVTGRADYLGEPHRYRVEYKAATGRASEEWWLGRQLEAA